MATDDVPIIPFLLLLFARHGSLFSGTRMRRPCMQGVATFRQQTCGVNKRDDRAGALNVD